MPATIAPLTSIMHSSNSDSGLTSHNPFKLSLSILEEEHKRLIFKSIAGSDEVPWCSGVLNVDASLIKLFYEGEGGIVRYAHS